MRTWIPAAAALGLLAATAQAQTIDPGLELGQPAVKEQVRRALQELLERPAFFTVAGAPAAELGFDGDAALDLVAGALWRKQDGAWARIGELWLDPSIPDEPPPPPPAP